MVFFLLLILTTHTHSIDTVQRPYQCYKGCTVLHSVDLVHFVCCYYVFKYLVTQEQFHDRCSNINCAKNKIKTSVGGNLRFYAFYVCMLRIVLIKTKQCQLKSLKMCAVIEVLLYTLPYECYVRKM